MPRSRRHRWPIWPIDRLWNPAGSLNVGIEYLFGTHRLEGGADVRASRVQFAAKYDLFRKRALEP